MSNQVGFAVEQNMCMGCKACQAACKDKNDLEVGELFREVTETEGMNPEVYAFWTSLACNHCQEPACVPVCPVEAITKTEKGGIVVIDQEKCIGCRSCEKACPYDAPQYLKEEEKMGKCDYCIDLVIQGKEQVCTAACPMRVLHSGELSGLQEEYGGITQVAKMPKPLTKPSITIVPHKDAQK